MNEMVVGGSFDSYSKQVAFVGFQPVQSGEHMAAMGMTQLKSYMVYYV